MSNSSSKKRAYPARAAARLTTAFVATVALIGTLLLPVAAHAAGPCDAPTNPIVCENSKQGTDPATWDITGAGDESIQGFSTDISVNVGSRVDFKIDTTASNYTINIYRTGYYDGDGARFIQQVTPIAGVPKSQQVCPKDAATELVDCGRWLVSASWDVPSTAVSGVYVALLTRPDTGGKSHITFIVRNQASTSAVLFQTSDPTWHAYNTYGGSNFYQGAGNGRAYKVSYNRPFYTRASELGRDFYFSNEYPLVRFLEKNGYDVSYFSGVDTDRYGALLTNHKVFLSVGHDEYWSAGQRANVEAARDAGVNMQFLSGNEAYWRTRYEPSTDPGQTPYRTLVSYKETWNTQEGKLDTSTAQWSGTWRDPRYASTANGGGLPENSLTGTAYMANNTDLAVTVTAAQGKMRMWRGTGLSSMTGATQALAPHTIGYESNEDLDNGQRQSGLVRMSATTGGTPEYLTDFGRVTAPGTTTHNVTLYRTKPNGALVFGAGTIQWTWGLDQEHDGNGAAADLRMQQAQVNLLADMDAFPLTLDPTLALATKSNDATSPSVTVTSPSVGSTIANGTPVTLTGTASDTTGIVAGVNVSTDNGVTWHPASGTTNWTYSYVQHGRGTVPVLVRAIDDSGNFRASPHSFNYSVSGPFGVIGAEVPKTPDAGAASNLQLGLTFTPSVNGYVSGVRFYKSAANTGAHTGSLWDAAGVRLATANFVGESASGWQTVTFTSAVPVQAGSKYTVSYLAPVGHYAASTWHWATRGDAMGPITVAGGYGAEFAGSYGQGETYPDQRHNGTNYYVDPVFDVIDSTPLSATKQWPLPGSTSVPTGEKITAVMSKPVTASTVSFTVTPQGGSPIAGSVAYDAATKKATFTPASALAAAKQYTLSVIATATTGGGVTAGGTWSFTTAIPAPPVGTCPCSAFNDGTQPEITQVADASAVTLGARFSPTVNGTITAVKFYKAPGNTGPHTGILYNSAGGVMSSAAFGAESTAGWQTVTLPSPVAVTAGSTYTVAYRTQSGNYSVTSGEYATGYTRGPLTFPYAAGVYSYADVTPTSTTTTSYMVDVVFSRTPSALTLVSTTPGSGATNVARSSTITAQLSGPIGPGYSLSATSQGANIAGVSSLSTDGKTITFTPSSVLPNGSTVSVTLSGVVSTEGVNLAPQNWSFSTVNESTTTVTNTTLFGSETPVAAAATGESDPLELGVSFTPSVAGSVTAIRFYKGAGNGGAHVGRLWNSTGTQQLASVNFINETASGWQSAQLSTAVPLTPGQTYVVSYFAPQGHYASTSGYFSQPKVSGPLTAGTANNGRYLYSGTGGFPTGSWGATNYFVDVVYTVTSAVP